MILVNTFFEANFLYFFAYFNDTSITVFSVVSNMGSNGALRSGPFSESSSDIKGGEFSLGVSSAAYPDLADLRADLVSLHKSEFGE